MLTNYINTNLPQFRIHLCKPEPGVSWDSYKNRERGFCVWLVKSKDFKDPMHSLKSALQFYKTRRELMQNSVEVVTEEDKTKEEQNEKVQKDEEEEEEENIKKDQDNEELSISQLMSQLQVVKSNLDNYYKEMAQIETLIRDLWPNPVPATTGTSKDIEFNDGNEYAKEEEEESATNKSIEEDNKDWCVVDDDIKGITVGQSKRRNSNNVNTTTGTLNNKYLPSVSNSNSLGVGLFQKVQQKASRLGVPTGSIL